MTAILRFAPSPNGPLHLGHALSAIVAFDMAKQLGGHFLVRIEDIDIIRCRPQWIAAALDDLRWLGLSWDEPVLRQSEHFPVYLEAARRLERMGVLYPCFATRADISDAALAHSAGHDPDGAPLYPLLHKHLPAADIARRKSAGEPFALRLDMARALDVLATLSTKPLTFTAIDEHGTRQVVAAHPERWGDAVIVRKDTPASYHLSVVVDDARQGITHVTRGQDLLAATDLHRLLQVLLGLPEPLYYHHTLITDETGRKLAKSAGDTSLAELRAQGCSPADIRRKIHDQLAQALPALPGKAS